MVTFETIPKHRAPDAMSTVDSREWFDSEGSAEIGSIELPEPNEDYFYGATRALSFWPVVNSRGATYEKEDFDDINLGSLLGVQTNLIHDKKKVIGSIVSYNMTGHGIDVGFRGDREQAAEHGFDVMDMKPGNDFSQASVELTKDVTKNVFYVYDDEGTIKHKIPVPEGRNLGLRRTTANDPYRYQGMKVAERIRPLRFTGLGLVPNPADKTAQLFKVAASATSEETVIATAVLSEHANPPTQEHTMSEAEIQALNAQLATLQASVTKLTSEKEAASAEVGTVRQEFEAQLAALKTELESAKTELASAISERDTLKTEKETAAKEGRVDALLADLAEIMAPADDAAKTALREQASAIVDDAMQVRLIKAERTAEAMKAKIAAIEQASAETPEQKTAREAKEQADAAKIEKEKFEAEHPNLAIAPVYSGTVNGKSQTASREDLLKNF